MLYTVEQLKNLISPIAAKHGIAAVSLFGSYSKGLAKESSDVDLLIEKGKLETLFELIDFRHDVEDILNLPVDVVTTETSDKSFLSRISKDGVLLYRTT
ncbi:MAG: nucleotidyltransferase domain-containing protein [Acidaminococcaceae bacterium]|nr:nucleotidyltransferase domain-containing protein [Acidaminococcaceae bacterium]